MFDGNLLTRLYLMENCFSLMSFFRWKKFIVYVSFVGLIYWGGLWVTGGLYEWDFWWRIDCFKMDFNVIFDALNSN